MVGAIGFFVLCIAVVAVGWAICERLWIRFDSEAALDATTSLERISAAAAAGAMLWFAINWLLALTHALTQATLSFAAIMFVIAALLMVARGVRLPKPDRFALVACVPIALWIVYVLWRGMVLPPDNHDVLAYHLPKAVFIAQSHGYGYFVTGDPRVTVLPANYELLLSDILILTGTDHITEWLGTVFYILFLIATGAAIERWFGRGPHVAASVIATSTANRLRGGLSHSDRRIEGLIVCDSRRGTAAVRSRLCQARNRHRVHSAMSRPVPNSHFTTSACVPTRASGVWSSSRRMPGR